jgi:hypothetical protein
LNITPFFCRIILLLFRTTPLLLKDSTSAFEYYTIFLQDYITALNNCISAVEDSTAAFEYYAIVLLDSLTAV